MQAEAQPQHAYGKVIFAVKTDTRFGICAVFWPLLTSSYSCSRRIFFFFLKRRIHVIALSDPPSIQHYVADDFTSVRTGKTWISYVESKDDRFH